MKLVLTGPRFNKCLKATWIYNSFFKYSDLCKFFTEENDLISTEICSTLIHCEKWLVLQIVISEKIGLVLKIFMPVSNLKFSKFWSQNSCTYLLKVLSFITESVSDK
jgi:hypothetical protein